MSGNLIFVSGISGSGKTTLVHEAINRLDDLQALLTYTTRPMRSSEGKSHEYVFVTDAQYEELKSQSRNWDETIYHNFKYGTDAARYIKYLENGQNIIASVAPNLSIIRTMEIIYKTEITTIWIDTETEIAAKRVADDKARSERIEADNKVNFDIVFTPKGSLNDDGVAFANLIGSIILPKR